MARVAREPELQIRVVGAERQIETRNFFRRSADGREQMLNRISFRLMLKRFRFRLCEGKLTVQPEDVHVRLLVPLLDTCGQCFVDLDRSRRQLRLLRWRTAKWAVGLRLLAPSASARLAEDMLAACAICRWPAYRLA